jgi:hypothetical protein
MGQEDREVIARLENDIDVLQERCTALEAMVASLRINQHRQPAICAIGSTECLYHSEDIDGNIFCTYGECPHKQQAGA